MASLQTKGISYQLDAQMAMNLAGLQECLLQECLIEDPSGDLSFKESSAMLENLNDQRILSKIENIGRYMATRIEPTIPPTKTIIAGSISEVRVLTAVVTSSS